MNNRVAIESCSGGFRILLLMPVDMLGKTLWVIEVAPGSFKTAREAAKTADQLEVLWRQRSSAPSAKSADESLAEVSL
jgi:hypothetical protein